LLPVEDAEGRAWMRVVYGSKALAVSTPSMHRKTALPTL